MNVAELTAVLRAEVAPFVKGMQDSQKELAGLRKQVADTSAALTRDLTNSTSDATRALDNLKRSTAAALKEIAGLEQAGKARKELAELDQHAIRFTNTLKGLSGANVTATAGLGHFGGATQNVSNLMAQAGINTGILGAAVGALTSPFGIAAAAMVALGLGIKTTTDYMVQNYQQMRSLMAVSGLEAEAADQLADTFDLLGFNVDALRTALFKMAGEVDSGGKGLRELGVEIRTSSGAMKTEGAIFLEVRDRISAMGSSAERNAAIMERFGRAGKELAPVFALNTVEFNKWLEAAGKIGPSAAESMRVTQEYTRASAALNKEWQGMVETMGQALLPKLTELLKVMRDLASVKPGGTGDSWVSWLNELGSAIPAPLAGLALLTEGARKAKQAQDELMRVDQGLGATPPERVFTISKAEVEQQKLTLKELESDQLRSIAIVQARTQAAVATNRSSESEAAQQSIRLAGQIFAAKAAAIDGEIALIRRTSTEAIRDGTEAGDKIRALLGQRKDAHTQMAASVIGLESSIGAAGVRAAKAAQEAMAGIAAAAAALAVSANIFPQGAEAEMIAPFLKAIEQARAQLLALKDVLPAAEFTARLTVFDAGTESLKTWAAELARGKTVLEESREFYKNLADQWEAGRLRIEALEFSYEKWLATLNADGALDEAKEFYAQLPGKIDAAVTSYESIQTPLDNAARSSLAFQESLSGIQREAALVGRDFDLAGRNLDAFKSRILELQAIKNPTGEILDEIDQLKAKFADTREFIEWRDMFQDVFSSVGGAINTLVQGVILGTQTMAQAWNKLWQSIAISFVNSGIQRLLKGLQDTVWDIVLGLASGGSGGSGGGSLLSFASGLIGGGNGGGFGSVGGPLGPPSPSSLFSPGNLSSSGISAINTLMGAWASVTSTFQGFVSVLGGAGTLGPAFTGIGAVDMFANGSTFSEAVSNAASGLSSASSAGLSLTQVLGGAAAAIQAAFVIKSLNAGPWGASHTMGQSVLTGAGLGASIGTMIMPGIGTAIGAVGGALMGILAKTKYWPGVNSNSSGERIGSVISGPLDMAFFTKFTNSPAIGGFLTALIAGPAGFLGKLFSLFGKPDVYAQKRMDAAEQANAFLGTLPGQYQTAARSGSAEQMLAALQRSGTGAAGNSIRTELMLDAGIAQSLGIDGQAIGNQIVAQWVSLSQSQFAAVLAQYKTDPSKVGFRGSGDTPYLDQGQAEAIAAQMAVAAKGLVDAFLAFEDVNDLVNAQANGIRDAMKDLLPPDLLAMFDASTLEPFRRGLLDLINQGAPQEAIDSMVKELQSKLTEWERFSQAFAAKSVVESLMPGDLAGKMRAGIAPAYNAVLEALKSGTAEQAKIQTEAFAKQTQAWAAFADVLSAATLVDAMLPAQLGDAFAAAMAPRYDKILAALEAGNADLATSMLATFAKLTQAWAGLGQVTTAGIDVDALLPANFAAAFRARMQPEWDRILGTLQAGNADVAAGLLDQLNKQLVAWAAIGKTLATLDAELGSVTGTVAAQIAAWQALSGEMDRTVTRLGETFAAALDSGDVERIAAASAAYHDATMARYQAELAMVKQIDAAIQQILDAASTLVQTVTTIATLDIGGGSLGTASALIGALQGMAEHGETAAMRLWAVNQAFQAIIAILPAAIAQFGSLASGPAQITGAVVAGASPFLAAQQAAIDQATGAEQLALLQQQAAGWTALANAAIAGVNQWAEQAIAGATAAAQALTDGIDQQIDGIQRAEQLAAESRRSEMEGLQDRIAKQREFVAAIKSMGQFIEQLKLGSMAPSNPMDQLLQAQGSFASALAAFNAAPTATGLGDLQTMAQAVLQAGAGVYTRPSPEYQDLFGGIVAQLETANALAQTQAPDDSTVLQAQLDALQEIERTASRAASDQIAALNDQKRAVAANLAIQVQAIRDAAQAETAGINAALSAALTANAAQQAPLIASALAAQTSLLQAVTRGPGSGLIDGIAYLAMGQDVAIGILGQIRDGVYAAVGIQGAAGGMAYVPKTMPVVVHQGERILTKEENADYGRGNSVPSASVPSASVPQSRRGSSSQQFTFAPVVHVTGGGDPAMIEALVAKALRKERRELVRELSDRRLLRSGG